MKGFGFLILRRTWGLLISVEGGGHDDDDHHDDDADDHVTDV